jgi:hypothetical protein
VKGEEAGGLEASRRSVSYRVVRLAFWLVDAMAAESLAEYFVRCLAELLKDGLPGWGVVVILQVACRSLLILLVVLVTHHVLIFAKILNIVLAHPEGT